MSEEIDYILTKKTPGGAKIDIGRTQDSRKIYLAHFSVAGATEMYKYSKDERVYEYMESSAHSSLEETTQYIESRLARTGNGLAKANGKYWFIRRIEDDRMLGSVALTDLDRKRLSVCWGFALDPEFWGEGYIYEVQEIIKDYVFNELGLNRLWSVTYITNERTKQTVLAGGFQSEGVLREYYRDEKGHFIDAWLYGMLKTDFYNQQPEKKNVHQVDEDDLIRFIGDILHYDTLDRNSTIADIPTWDSLNHVTLMVALEEKYRIKLSPLEIAKCTSVCSIYSTISSK
ncbi:MAG: hypothetical protein CL784_03585 [Chloroflexi bacterium]|nr:hypothetical protein [Chloroflexota bacterium]|tara:strand:- start:166 stop:1026 length:861 start_codon:yes stop_codon:yes gene_type:complete